MPSIEQAYEVYEDGISIKGIVGIFAGADDPTISGFDAPIGSVYLRTNGLIYRKTGSINEEWNEDIVGGGSSSGLANGYDGHIAVSVAYNASNKTIILVDTTTQAVQITLPDAVAYADKLFIVKWKAGPNSNKPSVVPQSGQTIDTFNEIVFSRLLHCLHFVSDGANWWMV